MIIAEIKDLLPVPDVTYENNHCDWIGLSEEIETSFPEAYVEFVNTYGTGTIGDFLWVLNPFSKNSNLNWEQARYFQDAYQALKTDFPEYYPRDKESFLPWGFTDNGDALVWLIDQNDSNEWLVSIQAANPTQEEETGLTTLGFLTALIEKKLSSSILPTDFLSAKKEFIVSK